MSDTGVSVVIATRGRPTLLRRAIASILAQTTKVPLEIIVVFDQVEPDPLADVDVGDGRFLLGIRNEHSTGLAGGRNSGIGRARFAFVAFCDDDDEWKPGKIERQLALAAAAPDAVVIASGIQIESHGGSHIRLAPETTTLGDLLESRITELHPSSFLIRRHDLESRLGTIDEDIPGSYGEDYDLLLRAAKLAPVVAVPEPLVIVHWDRASFFSEKWESIVGGLSYLLEKHPEFDRTSRGKARIQGQVAFAYAALGQVKDARHWASATLRNDRRQLRGYAAYAIASRLLPAGLIVSAINSRGRGL
ncbi:MAG TPA: glycosyltransferase [Mycetocola sp.]|jgi:glycosyltransferase involved in cell wall biosynthesis|nr:glycosyltransferase [Mycetocola sp.]